MIKTIYLEDQIADHPRARAICARFPEATRIPCETYGEVFNRKSQNFRLQKQRPALILARKHNKLVLDAPAEYSIGGERNLYFSHMLNCIYDCRYCFLQGMYRSAHYVLFVNYEDMAQAIVETAAQTPDQDCYFFSGYDCDSLALEPVTGFVDFILPVFARRPNAYLELRTKSTQIRGLLEREPIANCIVAFSLAPDAIVGTLEHKTPSLARRIEAMRKLQQRGWQVGLRFDPLIYHDNYQTAYQQLFDDVFAQLESDRIHSVSLGCFRIPEPFHRNITRMYPDEPLFAGPLCSDNGMVGYDSTREQELMEFCSSKLLQHIPPQILYPAH